MIGIRKVNQNQVIGVEVKIRKIRRMMSGIEKTSKAGTITILIWRINQVNSINFSKDLFPKTNLNQVQNLVLCSKPV